MTFSAGDRLGSFEILGPLGAGGMGEVFRARDVKLGREVAIKVMSDAFASDPERLARFEREARLLASLNHPNIGALHGVEEANGILGLILELVPGQTLAERLAAGPFDVREALQVCRQIAEGLEAAHEKGIIHRDLKPANVKITPEGKVKVLDFGLAKAFGPEASSSNVSQSPTATHAASEGGAIVGTVAYMSPEQARGKPVDRRTDVWSFGCLLYELLTRRKAFDGETVSDILVAILEREPDWAALPAATPQKIRDLLRRCVQKDPHGRLHDIADARIEIEEALAARGPEALEAPPHKRRALTWPVAAMGVAAAVGAGLGWLARRPPDREGGPRMRLVQVARLTHDVGLSEGPAWSPDGNLLAFASNRTGNFDIYVRRLDGGQEVSVTNDPAEDIQPAFSPDGKSLAFVSTRSSRTGLISIGAPFQFEFRTYGGDLWVAPTLGGRARRLAVDANFPVWHPDGRRIAYVSGVENHRTILEVPIEGGAPKPILAAASSQWEIDRLQYAPGGRWLSFENAPDRRLMLAPATGGKPRHLLSASHHAWDSSGHRLHFLAQDALGGTRLESADIDLTQGSRHDEPETAGILTGIVRELAVSPDGRRLAVSELEGSMNLTLLPLAAGGGMPSGSERVLSSGQVLDRWPAFSPDGRRIAFGSNRLGPPEIWIYDLAAGTQERLELPGRDLPANWAYWSPDGRQLSLVRYAADGSRSLWRAAIDGSHAEPLIEKEPSLEGGPFSPDGRRILYSVPRDGFLQFFLLDVATRQTRQLTTSSSDKYSGAFSPDGKWIAFSSNEGGTTAQVWRMPAEGGPAERLTSSEERMRHVFYSPDGRWIYVQPSHRNIHRLPAAGGRLEQVTRFPESGLLIEEPTLSPDGRFLAYSRRNGGSSLWLLTLGESRQH